MNYFKVFQHTYKWIIMFNEIITKSHSGIDIDDEEKRILLNYEAEIARAIASDIEDKDILEIITRHLMAYCGIKEKEIIYECREKRENQG